MRSHNITTLVRIPHSTLYSLSPHHTLITTHSCTSSSLSDLCISHHQCDSRTLSQQTLCLPPFTSLVISCHLTTTHLGYGTTNVILSLTTMTLATSNASIRAFTTPRTSLSYPVNAPRNHYEYNFYTSSKPRPTYRSSQT